jgi:hypothetical protein
MKSEIKKVPCNIDDHRQWLKENAKFNDLEKRIRWDFYHAAKLSKFVCDKIYPYADDTHIDTALKNIIQDIEQYNI